MRYVCQYTHNNDKKKKIIKQLQFSMHEIGIYWYVHVFVCVARFCDTFIAIQFEVFCVPFLNKICTACRYVCVFPIFFFFFNSVWFTKGISPKIRVVTSYRNKRYNTRTSFSYCCLLFCERKK